MQPVDRQSITTTLDVRYAQQHAGMAFDVKQVLGNPGTTPPVGEVIDAASANGQTFQNPNGFQVKILGQQSQLLAVQSSDTKGLSTYVQGLSTVKYHP
jgi:hypothetical protein